MKFNLLTNADQGIVLTWSQYGNPEVSGMAVTTGTSVNVVDPPAVAGQLEVVAPTLQAQDGSFVGTVGTGDPDAPTSDMVAFDARGNVRWVVPNICPKVATADGGVIAQMPQGPYGSCDNLTGPAYTFDANGNATGQTNLFTKSWLGYTYRVGSAEEIVGEPVNPGDTYATYPAGNESANETAAKELFAPLQSCKDKTANPSLSCPQPFEAVNDAWEVLKARLNDTRRTPVSMSTFSMTLLGRNVRNSSLTLALDTNSLIFPSQRCRSASQNVPGLQARTWIITIGSRTTPMAAKFRQSRVVKTQSNRRGRFSNPGRSVWRKRPPTPKSHSNFTRHYTDFFS